ncbi:MAG TPA: serine hydrolase [Bryobacteraceae bacterium]|nr:serine hydrolase [Bryobacteraceae bacterium]
MPRAPGTRVFATLLIILLCAFAGSAAGQTAAADALERKTIARLQALDERTEGVVGVAAIDLTDGHTLAWNPDVICASASTIKVPVMIEVYRQQIPRGRQLTLAPSDLIASSDRLEVLLRRGPATFTVRELLAAMIEVSDNTAANTLIKLVGMDRVNAALEQMGLKATRLRRIMLDSAAARRGDDNTATPLELAKLAEFLYRGEGADAEEMTGFLKRVEAGVRKAVPAAVDVASKPGEVPGARSELAIVYLQGRPFALGVMSAFLRDGVDPVPEAASIVYGHFERLARSNRYGNRLP